MKPAVLFFASLPATAAGCGWLGGRAVNSAGWRSCFILPPSSRALRSSARVWIDVRRELRGGCSDSSGMQHRRRTARQLPLQRIARDHQSSRTLSRLEGWTFCTLLVTFLCSKLLDGSMFGSFGILDLSVTLLLGWVQSF